MTYTANRLIIKRPLVALVFIILITVLCSIISVAGFNAWLMNSGKYVSIETYNETVSTYEARLDQARVDMSIKDSQLASAKETVDKLDAQVKDISKNADYLVNKYYYYYKEKGKNATINLVELSLMDKLGKAKDINPHTIVALTKFEASWNKYCADTSGNSNSAGYGQFLGSTGKFVSTQLLHRGGEYNHRVVSKDGETSIEMIYAYVDYLLERKDGNLRKALESYNGSYRKEQYAENINQYLIKRGLGSLTNYAYR